MVIYETTKSIKLGLDNSNILGGKNMKCPNCGSETVEIKIFSHYEKCPNCGYEEEDIFVTNNN